MNFRSVFVALVIGTALLVAAFLLNWYRPRFVTEQPSAVVVCEKHDGQTTMQRLDPREMTKWLKKYRLGQLWTDAQLGGNRW